MKDARQVEGGVPLKTRNGKGWIRMQRVGTMSPRVRPFASIGGNRI